MNKRRNYWGKKACEHIENVRGLQQQGRQRFLTKTSLL